MSPELQDPDSLWRLPEIRGKTIDAESYTALRASDAAALAEREDVDLLCERSRSTDRAFRKPVNSALLVVPSSAHAQLYRAIAGSVMVLDCGGEIWEPNGEWTRHALGAGSQWLNPGAMPLHHRAQQCVDTIARVLASGQSVIFHPSRSVCQLLVALAARGVSDLLLRSQCYIVPDEIPYSRVALEHWFKRGCPSLPLDSVIECLRDEGTAHWAAAVYEAIFKVLLSARQARDGAHMTVSCSRALLQILVWMREGDETAVRLVASETESPREVGIVRCLVRKGMLLLGVNWKITAVRELPVDVDCDWLSFLYGRHPDSEAAIADAGGIDERGDEMVARHDVFGRAAISDITLQSRGVLKHRGKDWVLGTEYSAEESRLYRRGKPVSSAEIAQSTGSTELALDALAARLAFRLGNIMCGRAAGSRRRFELTLQRAVGAAAIPPPTIIVSANPDADLCADRWRNSVLSFRWAMPIDRRRRDAYQAMNALRSSMLTADSSVPAILGSAALDGLISLDGQSVFFGAKGDALATYLWTNFPHLFQKEYTAWVRESLSTAGPSGINEALRLVVSDLAAVLR